MTWFKNTRMAELENDMTNITTAYNILKDQAEINEHSLLQLREQNKYLSKQVNKLQFENDHLNSELAKTKEKVYRKAISRDSKIKRVRKDAKK